MLACAQGRVAATLWAAVILWSVRVAGVYIGSWAGARAAGAPKEHRWRVWQGMITQARLPRRPAAIAPRRLPPALVLGTLSRCIGTACQMQSSIPKPNPKPLDR